MPTFQSQTSSAVDEHESRLQELLSRQAELTRMLDLDKSDQQAVEADTDVPAEREATSIGEAAASFMRERGGAMKDMPVTERKAPDTGAITGRAVARADSNLAVSTAANSFVVVQLNGAAGEVVIGERVTIRLQHGVATLEPGIERGR